MSDEMKREKDIIGEGLPSTNNIIENTPKKRGRKPNPNKKIYFGEEEEKYFVEFINSTDQKERDRIFSEKLYFPFSKMIESIIRRYHLGLTNEQFEDTFFDTMSFLITKISNFDTTKNFKAYSYCGTICKNYLILRKTQHSKNLTREVYFDNVSNTIEDKHIVETNVFEEINPSKEMIEENIKLLEKKLNDKKQIITYTDNEINVGNALLELLKNWEEILEELGSKKFNKMCVLQFLKEYTNLSTKDIRDAMKRYKRMYIDIRNDLLSN